MKSILSILFICALSLTVKAQSTDSAKFIGLPKIIGLHYQPQMLLYMPLCFLDGKQFPADSLNTINMDLIESVEVINALAAREKYGDFGKDGAVLITLKKAERIKKD